jgi:hypothetical protein
MAQILNGAWGANLAECEGSVINDDECALRRQIGFPILANGGNEAKALFLDNCLHLFREHAQSLGYCNFPAGDDGRSLPSCRSQLAEKTSVIGPHPFLEESAPIVKPENSQEIPDYMLAVRRQRARQ